MGWEILSKRKGQVVKSVLKPFECQLPLVEKLDSGIYVKRGQGLE